MLFAVVLAFLTLRLGVASAGDSLTQRDVVIALSAALLAALFSHLWSGVS